MLSMKNPVPSDISRIFSCFDTGHTFSTASVIGTGHINDSYLITTENPAASFVLQRINDSIFRDIPGLMNNILIVTRHIAQKTETGHGTLSGSGTLTGSQQFLRVIPAREGSSYHTDINGSFWRLYNHISNSHCYDRITNPGLAREAGRMLGKFLCLTNDIPVNKLVETIPRFHDVKKRLNSFRNTVEKDPAGRVSSASVEISFVEKRSSEMSGFFDLCNSDSIPLRIVHNDTKINNILFNDKNQAICLVDLDTVMPGIALFDFGDAIRTGANKGDEDDESLEKVGINLSLFEQYAAGYLETAGPVLTGTEKEHLAFPAMYMTYIIGLRFLTDYLDGDIYYRIHYPGHNLQRAKAQFRLLSTMEEQFPEMKKIADELILQ